MESRIISNKAGLNHENYGRIMSLLKVWDRDPKFGQRFAVNSHGRGKFSLYIHAPQAEEANLCFIGSIAEVIAYLKGAIHGAQGWINIA